MAPGKRQVKARRHLVYNHCHSLVDFIKSLERFFSSDIVDNWACYSKCSRMILNQLLLNINCWVYFYYRIMCGVFIV